MKNTAFKIAFTPVAISMICGILLAVNSVIHVLPAWPIWGLVIVSTTVAVFTVGSVLVIGVAQWLMQYVNKQTV